MWTVYKHTSPSGKVYIGITSQKVKKRWENGHGYKSQIFYRAIKKYGWDNINHEILFEGLTKKQACEMEQHLIEKYDCIIPKGYNKSKGGEYGALGIHHSIETRRKISEANKRAYLNPELRRKLSEANKGQIPWVKGKHLSADHRQKISEAHKGKHLSSETRKKLSESHKGQIPWAKGKHLSPETRRKISEAKKGANNQNYGKHFSAEHRRKIGESNKGKHRSAETLRKIREACAKAVICVETGTLYSSCREAAESIGVTNGAISMAVRGIRKTAGGYHWKYVES